MGVVVAPAPVTYTVPQGYTHPVAVAPAPVKEGVLPASTGPLVYHAPTLPVLPAAVPAQYASAPVAGKVQYLPSVFHAPVLTGVAPVAGVPFLSGLVPAAAAPAVAAPAAAAPVEAAGEGVEAV